VMVGSLDREDFRQIADRLAEELPQARHVVIEGAAHLPAMERPEATAQEIDRFLVSLDAGGA
jgi:pimeloyl-ACP methyl ester carboxylesterase